MNQVGKSDLIDLLDKNSGEGNTPIRQGVNLLKQLVAEIIEWKRLDAFNEETIKQLQAKVIELHTEIHFLKKDEKRLDWIWKEASKLNGGGVFQIKGIELFTVATQHITSTKGIRQLLDAAIEIKEQKQ